MLYLRQRPTRKPNPGEVVLDPFGREYRVKVVGAKYLYADPVEGGSTKMFHILQVVIKPATAPPPPKPTIDEEFLA